MKRATQADVAIWIRKWYSWSCIETYWREGLGGQCAKYPAREYVFSLFWVHLSMLTNAVGLLGGGM